MPKKTTCTCRLGWWMTLLGAISLFAFYQLMVPYQLRHREQTMLFLSSADWIRAHYLTLRPGALAQLVGDWLQQFFYYLGAGAALLSLLLTLIGVTVYQTVKHLIPTRWGRWAGGLMALMTVLWEAHRECLPDYPLASTLQVLGWSASLWCLSCLSHHSHRAVGLSVLLVAGHLLWGYGLLPGAKLWGRLSLATERLMALDVEASFGHWDRVETLSQAVQDYNLGLYYQNLSQAKQGRLAEDFLQRGQNGAEGLFLPVNEQGNYFLFAAAGEVWWALGDMTTAEHATLLGMIFSPRHTGSRCLRRLAEINLAKGDTAAAMKYLRMLDQSFVHHVWAQPLIRQMESDALTLPQQSLLPTQDTLLLSGEVTGSLRNLLDCHPEHLLARDYLLCYDLSVQDLMAFTDDVQRYGAPVGQQLYEEAMLIVMASRPEMRELWQPLVREQTYLTFQAFNQAYEQAGHKAAPLKARFGNTYWYYFCFAKPKE